MNILEATLLCKPTIINLSQHLEMVFNTLIIFRKLWFYMTATEVGNLESTVKNLKYRGVPLINDDPESRKKGVPISIHPKAARDLFIELIEKAKV